MSFSYSILSVLCMHTDDSACELSAVFGVKPLASVVANIVFVGRRHHRFYVFSILRFRQVMILIKLGLISRTSFSIKIFRLLSFVLLK